MDATLTAAPLDEPTRAALRQFFAHTSAYVAGSGTARPQHHELATRWDEQQILDNAIAAIASGQDQQALALAPRFAARPAVFVGLLARMLQSHRPGLIAFVLDAVDHDVSLTTRRFAGRTLLHDASAAGCLEAVKLLLSKGADPNIEDQGAHTPLYTVANECAAESGPEIVRALIKAGANVNAAGGVTRATPLHMAARRGHLEIAKTLLDCGARIDTPDSKGDTPLQRAINCRRHAVVQLLEERGARRRRSVSSA